MKPTVFYFSAAYGKDGAAYEYDERDGGIIRTLAFVIKVAMPENFGTGEDDDPFQLKLCELEGKYGVHDWGSAPVDEVDAVGLGTYEMSAEDFEKCVTEWRDWYISLFGEENVTPIVDVSYLDNAPIEGVFVNDLGYYNAAMAGQK